MSQPDLFNWHAALAKGPVATPSDGGDEPRQVAPARVRMAPAATAARRAGRKPHKVVTKPSAPMLVYRDALRAIQPATDHEVSAYLRRQESVPAESARWSLSSVNARRGDWLSLDPACIEAVDRVRAEGRTRARYRITHLSIADWAAGGRS